jgi:DNA-binding transcriptional ArsR family regulator
MTAVLMPGSTLASASARFYRVLGDPTRLAILERLLERPHTVSELVGSLGVPQSRVSTHLACLRWCEFVDVTRGGRQATYAIRDRRLRGLLDLGQMMADERREHLASCGRVGPDWI